VLIGEGLELPPGDQIDAIVEIDVANARDNEQLLRLGCKPIRLFNSLEWAMSPVEPNRRAHQRHLKTGSASD